jgi:hypothetical protein
MGAPADIRDERAFATHTGPRAICSDENAMVVLNVT